MRELARERARESLGAHAPQLSGRGLTELGRGTDNIAFLAGDLVLRVSAGPDVVREARLLAVVGPRVPLPIPRPQFVDEDRGVLAYPLLPGQPLLGQPPLPGLARRLGAFLRALHGIDPSVLGTALPRDDDPPAAWLVGLRGPASSVERLHESVPPPTEDRVVAHADLGAEHVLAQGAEPTGVIDWSDAALADPAVDFARLYRDVGPDFLAELLVAYGGLQDEDRTMRRVRFFARCAALDDLAYGRSAGRAEYVRSALRSVTWLFPDVPASAWDEPGRAVAEEQGPER